MAKTQVAIEISSTAIKLVVGYELDKEVVVLHAVEKPIPQGIVTGEAIHDLETVSSAINDVVKDAANTLNIEIKRIILALPPIGFEVYENSQSTNVVSASGIIAELDIRNVMTLLRRDQYSSENQVIDIIPQNYFLDQNRIFANAPLGETSASLHMKAFIHTIPPRIVSEFQKAAHKVGLEVAKLVVTSYGVGQLFTNYKEVPQQYLLIDFGANTTAISTIAGGKPFSSTFINNGGHDLTKHIANTIHLDINDAEFLKVTYGLCQNNHSFKPTLANSVDSDGLEKKYTSDDLNLIITDYLNNFVSMLKRALIGLLDDETTNLKLPMVFVGGSSKLNGLLPFMEKHFPDTNIIIPHIKSLGARNKHFTNCLGLIKVGSTVIFNEEKDVTKVAPLTREKKKFPKYSETEDKL